MADHDPFRELVDEILSRDLRPQSIQVCPLCQGTLRFYAEIYSSRGKKLLGVHLICDDCKAAMAVDLGEPLPKWVDEVP